jgi:hypothetical protein
VPGCITPVVVVPRALERESATLVVGHDEEPVAFVGGADLGCRYKRPLRIEPEPGKVSQDKGESSSNSEGRDVFQDDEVGSNVANNSGDVRPDPSVIGRSASGSGGAPRLTGEPGRDAMNVSTPASAVEGDKVSPDNRRIQPPRFHTRDKDAGRKGFPLDVTHHAVAGPSQLESKLKAADPGTEREASEGRYSHIRSPGPS